MGGVYNDNSSHQRYSIKKARESLQDRRFPVNIAKFLKEPILKSLC